MSIPGTHPASHIAHRGAIALLTLLFAAHGALLLGQRLYPFVDMPNHLAQATIVRFLDDPATAFPQFFVVDLFPRPNVLHLLWCAAPVWGDVETANRAFWCFYAISTLAAAGWLCRRMGGSPWLAFGVAPMLYPMSVAWGFVGFAAATPLLLFWLAEFPAYLGRPTIARGLVLAALAVLLFLAHALALLFALGLFGLVWLLAARAAGMRRALLGLVPLVPAAVLLLAWQVSERAEGGHVGHLAFLPYYYRTQYLASWGKRLAAWTSDLDWLGAQARWLAWAYAGVGLAALVQVVVRGWRKGAVGVRLALWARGAASGDLRALSVVIFLVAAVGAVVVLPERLPGYHLLFQRFSAWGWMAVWLAVAVGFGRHVPGWLRVGLPVLAAAHVALAAQHLRGFDRAAAGLAPALLPETPAASVLAGLIFQPYYGQHAAFLHAADYQIVWKRRAATTRFIDSRSFPVRRRPGSEAALPVFEEWLEYWAGSEGFDPHRYDAAEHVLVRGEVRGRAGEMLTGRMVVRQAGAWRVYGPRVGRRLE